MKPMARNRVQIRETHAQYVNACKMIEESREIMMTTVDTLYATAERAPSEDAAKRLRATADMIEKRLRSSGVFMPS